MKNGDIGSHFRGLTLLMITTIRTGSELVYMDTYSFKTSSGETWQRELMHKNPVSRTNRFWCCKAFSRSCQSWGVTCTLKLSPHPSSKRCSAFTEVSKYLPPFALCCNGVQPHTLLFTTSKISSLKCLRSTLLNTTFHQGILKLLNNGAPICAQAQKLASKPYEKLGLRSPTYMDIWETTPSACMVWIMLNMI